MLTQRDNDIAALEAKLMADKLFQEWLRSYLGKRAEYVREGDGRIQPGSAEDRATPEAEDWNGESGNATSPLRGGF